MEGETVVFLGGVLAHRGLLSFWPVAIAASGGSFLADQLLFFVGRYARENARIQNMTARPAFSRVTNLLEHYPTVFIMAFRFVYGMRTISPIAIGMSRIPIPKFIAFNALAAAIWGPVIAGAGFVFGHGLEQILGKLPLEKHLAVAVGAVIALIVLFFFYRKLSIR
ncbi:MAG: DedA family protein [Micavibrio sp.]|nr:DedA family protein [Micavibrio sp.]